MSLPKTIAEPQAPPEPTGEYHSQATPPRARTGRFEVVFVPGSPPQPMQELYRLLRKRLRILSIVWVAIFLCCLGVYVYLALQFPGWLTRNWFTLVFAFVILLVELSFAGVLWSR